MKRNLIITIIVVLALGGLVAISLASFGIGPSKPTAKKASMVSLFPEAANRNGEIPVFGPILDENASELPVSPVRGLRKLVTNIASAEYMSEETGFILYTHRENGHVYKLNPETGERAKVSNSTFTQTLASLFGKDKKGYRTIVRYFKNGQIASVSGVIATSTIAGGEPSELATSTPLNPAVIDVVVSPKRDMIASLIRTSTGSRLEVSDFDGGKPKTVFSSPLRQWIVTWPTDKIITLQTKASVNAPGTLLFINPTATSTAVSSSTTTEQMILRPVIGLTIKPNPAGTQILASQTTPDSLDFSLINISEPDHKQLLPVRTLPEKCVWSFDSRIIYCAVPDELPLDEYPDSWYRGDVIFTDSIWAINPTTLAARKIFNLPSAENEQYQIDVVKPFLSLSERYLYFINKRDNSLWELDLSITR